MTDKEKRDLHTETIVTHIGIVKDFYAFTEDDFRLDNYQSTKLSTKFEVAE